MINKTEENEIRVLLFGYINLNVMDGSAVFLSGITSMLALCPNIKIDLVVANPIRRDVLIRPLFDMENVNIISPYADEDLILNHPDWLENERMTFEEASDVISHYWNKANYDWFFIRGMEVAEELAEKNHPILKRTLVYVTGITNENQVLSPEKEEKIEKLFNNSAYLVCQTEEMKDFLKKKFKHITNNKEIITLNPMIPDTTDNFNLLFKERSSYNRLCYTGKFDVDWNSTPMVVAFRELREKYPELTLDVAGDKFNYRKDHPNFISDLKYLLSNTTNLKWHGAISRKEARDLIIESDIGITWRSKDMDASLELSTKLLEYGSLGKAVILNPTIMHKRIFGEDYPLYAESMDDFINVISMIQEDPNIYVQAAKRMFEVSQNFTYSSTLKKLMPYLAKEKLKEVFIREDYNLPAELENLLVKSPENMDLQFLDMQNAFMLGEITLQYDILHKYLLECSEYGEILKVEIIGDYFLIFIKKNNDGLENNYLRNNQHTELINLFNQNHQIRVLMNLNNQAILNAVNRKSQKILSKTIESESVPNKSVKELQEIIKRKDEELNRIKKKYNSLINSKMGKATLRYWKIRKKIKL